MTRLMQYGLVTVFGGSGFVGTQVVRELAAAGWRVRIACRKPMRAYETQPSGRVGQIQLMRADVTSREDVERALQGADACVNLVGILHEGVGRGFQQIHVNGSRNIAETCATFGIARLVQMSANGANAKGASAYARSKGEAEVAVLESVPTATILRPSIIFGQGDGFFERFAQMSTFTPALPLFGFGETRYQPVYVGDVARAVKGALERPDAAGRTYVLTGPTVYSFKQLMELVLKETGRGRLLLPLPFIAANFIGMFGNLQALVMKPVLTSDQAILLREDNVLPEGAEGLQALGVEPTAVEAIIPGYLWRYRKGGQFAEVAA